MCVPVLHQHNSTRSRAGSLWGSDRRRLQIAWLAGVLQISGRPSAHAFANAECQRSGVGLQLAWMFDSFVFWVLKQDGSTPSLTGSLWGPDRHHLQIAWLARVLQISDRPLAHGPAAACRLADVGLTSGVFIMCVPILHQHSSTRSRTGSLWGSDRRHLQIAWLAGVLQISG